MRVICPECHQKARIQKTNRISSGYADLYCACSDAECGHTFVMNLSFSHTLSPSAKTASQLAFELVKSLSPEAKLQLQRQLFPN